MLQRVKEVQESDLRMVGALARNIQRVLPVTQADIDAAAALGKGWVVWKVIEVNDPIDNLRGGTQLVIKQNSITPGQNVRRVLIVSGPGGETVVIGPGPSPLLLPDAIANTLSYVKAYGGTKQGLPDGYTQLEYIVFDTTQVIDTGFTPDNNSRIESKCYRTGADCWFYGAGPSNPRITLYHSNTGTCRWGYQSRSNVGFVADTEYTIVEDKNGLNINGVDNPWTSGTADDFTCDRSLTIGNNNGSTGTRYFAGNFYYMKIYDNNVLVRDFMPCQNASNVVGLYDRVNGVFYTDTGLVAGPTVVPAPDAPMDIVSNNGVLKYGVLGKNLFNVSANPLEQGGIASNDGQNTATSYNQRVRTNGYIPVKPNTVYTTSVKDLQIYYLEYTQDKTYADRHASGFSDNSVTFTTGANTYFIRLQFRKSDNSNINPSEVTNVQLEQGSTATEYEPYREGVYTDGTVETIEDTIGNTATAEMLLKVGDYQDVQSIIDGVVTRNVGVKVLDGTETYQLYGSGAELRASTTIAGKHAAQTGVTSLICSHFTAVADTTAGGVVGGQINCDSNPSYPTTIRIGINGLATTVDGFKSWLADQYAAGTPVIVIYPLATPTTESVAGQTLQVTDGDNTLEITQASLSGLELEAEYTKAE